MKNSLIAGALIAPLIALLAGCASGKPPQPDGGWVPVNHMDVSHTVTPASDMKQGATQ